MVIFVSIFFNTMSLDKKMLMDISVKKNLFSIYFTFFEFLRFGNPL